MESKEELKVAFLTDRGLGVEVKFDTAPMRLFPDTENVHPLKLWSLASKFLIKRDRWKLHLLLQGQRPSTSTESLGVRA